MLKRLRVENFRNIKHAELEFCAGVNVFYGDNAQGKTNMLEALSVCLGRGFRRARPATLTPFGSSDAETTLELVYEPDAFPGKENVVVYKLSGGNATVSINGIPLKNASDLYGELKHVVFAPEHLTLIKGSPELRRFYIDNIAVLQNKTHKRAAADYVSAMKQLAALNFDLAGNPEDFSTRDMMGIWNDILIRQGINLTYGRLKYFQPLRDCAMRIYNELTDGREELNMLYKSDIYGSIDEELPDFGENGLNELYLAYSKRLKAAESDPAPDHRIKVGVHKDDIVFNINGVNAREFGSQGQIKSLSLIMKLSEAEIIRSYNHEVPVMLLDEVLGELDMGRRDFIINRLGGAQVFITSCDYHDFENARDLRVWEVKNGEFHSPGGERFGLL